MFDPAIVGLGFAIAAQFGGFVWGAATIKSSVDTLTRSVNRLADNVEHLESAVSTLDKRVSILEDRQQRE